MAAPKDLKEQAQAESGAWDYNETTGIPVGERAYRDIELRDIARLAAIVASFSGNPSTMLQGLAAERALGEDDRDYDADDSISDMEPPAKSYGTGALARGQESTAVKRFNKPRKNMPQTQVIDKPQTHDSDVQQALRMFLE